METLRLFVTEGTGVGKSQFISWKLFRCFSKNDESLFRIARQVLVPCSCSMISNICLLHIHKRLCEIFGYLETQPFGNLSMGDLLQVPPIRSTQIFEACNNVFGDFINLWSLFLMTEMTKVMRQRGYQTFIDLLNNIRVGQYSSDNRIQPQQRKINIKNAPHDTTSKLSKLKYTKSNWCFSWNYATGFANFTFFKIDWWPITT